MSKRESKTITRVTEDERDEAMRQYALAKKLLEEREAFLDLEIEKLRQDHTSFFEVKNKVLEAQFAILERYILENKPLFIAPHPRKMRLAGGHEIGLQSSTAVGFVKVPGEKKKQTEKGFIVFCLSATAEIYKSFLRFKPEMDKASILDMRKTLASEPAQAVMLKELDEALLDAGAAVLEKEAVVVVLNTEKEGGV